MMPLTKLEINDSDNAEDRLPPPAVKAERPIVRWTAAQKNKLLKAAGMQELALNKLKAVAEIGAFVSQLGLYEIAVGKLAAAQSDIELIFAKTILEAQKYKDDPQTQTRLFEIQELLMRLRFEAIKLEFKAASEVRPQNNNGTGGNVPIPFPPNVAVQVNIDRVEQPHSDLK